MSHIRYVSRISCTLVYSTLSHSTQAYGGYLLGCLVNSWESAYRTASLKKRHEQRNAGYFIYSTCWLMFRTKALAFPLLLAKFLAKFSRQFCWECAKPLTNWIAKLGNGALEVRNQWFSYRTFGLESVVSWKNICSGAGIAGVVALIVLRLW